MPRRPRLIVVDPSIVWPEDEGVREVVGDWPGEHVVLRPALRPGDGPTPAFGYDVDAVVVMGSRASVNEASPWLDDLAAWLVPLLDGTRPRPLLGICFGHQLMARCAGGHVARIHADGSEERGVTQTLFEPCHLAPEGGPVNVIASHGEAVDVVPSRFRVVARRDRVTADALEHEDLPAFSVQFHPEAREEFLAARSIPPGPHDAAAFADQRLLLERFRAIAVRGR